MPITTATPRSVELGLLLRRYRVQSGLSQTELAQKLDKSSHSDISRWETGKLGITEADASALMAVFGITGKEREKVFELIHALADPNWLTTGVGQQLRVVREYEINATKITNVQPLLIPGPLQTKEYAVAVMMGAGVTREDADAGAEIRIARRDIITRENGVEYVAVISDHALRHPFCNPGTALDQLKHLLKFGQLPNVTIQVLSLSHGYNEALEGSFALIESDRFKAVVHLEQYRSRTTLTDPKDVGSYKLAAENVRRAAMSPISSMEFIAQLVEKMEL